MQDPKLRLCLMSRIRHHFYLLLQSQSKTMLFLAEDNKKLLKLLFWTQHFHANIQHILFFTYYTVLEHKKCILNSTPLYFLNQYHILSLKLCVLFKFSNLFYYIDIKEIIIMLFKAGCHT